LVCYSRPAVYAYVPNFVSIGLFCRSLAAKNPQFLTYFAIFWTSTMKKLKTVFFLILMVIGRLALSFDYEPHAVSITGTTYSVCLCVDAWMPAFSFDESL